MDGAGIYGSTDSHTVDSHTVDSHSVNSHTEGGNVVLVRNVLSSLHMVLLEMSDGREDDTAAHGAAMGAMGRPYGVDGDAAKYSHRFYIGQSADANDKGGGEGGGGGGGGGGVGMSQERGLIQVLQVCDAAMKSTEKEEALVERGGDGEREKSQEFLEVVTVR